ncbi:hypothetical protein [Streptomyces nigra]|uniref:hypothetical protein n=1 Tax=Streptomyces nigra TaxID=1827580 RepID=UPI00371009AA
MSAVAAMGGLSDLPADAAGLVTASLGSVALGAAYVALFAAGHQPSGRLDMLLAFVVGGLLGLFGWVFVVFGVFTGLLLGTMLRIGLVLTKRTGTASITAVSRFSLMASAVFGLLLRLLVP